MWERICDRFGPDNAAVVGMSRLTAANYAAGLGRRKTLRSAGPTLIDEAHNFRNNSQRRRTLLNFLKSGKRRRTILMSATPQNLAPGTFCASWSCSRIRCITGCPALRATCAAISPTLRTPRLTSGPAKRCATCCCAARTSSATTRTAN